MSPANKSPWWRAFDRVERAIGEPLEQAVASPTYVEVALFGMRVQRKVVGTALRATGGAVGTVLRAANIPTRDDVRRLSRQVTVLTGEVRALAAAQDPPLPRRDEEAERVG